MNLLSRGGEFPHYIHWLPILLAGWVLSACAPQPPVPSPGHLNTEAITTPQTTTAPIPAPVEHSPYIPLPTAIGEEELYTVVVDQVPVRELLFALARDANLNVDIHPQVSGAVTLNAIDQTLAQILDRIAEQTGLRYEMKPNRLSITPDTPYVKYYAISYVNMQRDTSSQLSVATQIAAASGGVEGGGGSGGNNSLTNIQSASLNHFWENLLEGVYTILNEPSAQGGQSGGNVAAHPESGVLTIRASERQHREIQIFLDKVLRSAQRQVLIEATIAEVILSDNYQAGIDWSRVSGDYSYTQQTDALTSTPAYVFAYNNPVSRFGDISATVQLLESYGNVKVLSSPKIMALNNQTAVLRVVDNRVYFTMNLEITDTDRNSRTMVETEVHTVPEGLIITVTPQIDETGVVTLHVRPTISRITGYITDPNPILSANNATNRIPEVEVREMESILKVNSGDIAIIGGLMQDISDQQTSGVPVLSRLPLVGDLFSYRNDAYRKSELVVFLRPLVIKDASLKKDLRDYRYYLPDPDIPERSPPTSLPLDPQRLDLNSNNFHPSSGWIE